jgi:hypothetical protein
MGFAKIRGKLRPRIGSPVQFGAPKDVVQKGGKPVSGTIIDEVWADPDVNGVKPHTNCQMGPECWGDYSFCAQLIEWDNGDHSIRLAYYRRRCGEDYWEYASQMTVNSDWATMKNLMERTLAKTTWFQSAPVSSAVPSSKDDLFILRVADSGPKTILEIAALCDATVDEIMPTLKWVMGRSGMKRYLTIHDGDTYDIKSIGEWKTDYVGKLKMRFPALNA